MTPRPELRDFVRIFVQRDVAVDGGEIVQVVPAYLEQIIEFEFGEVPNLYFDRNRIELAHRISTVGLLANKSASIGLRGKVTSFGIFFQPLSFSRLFRIPTSELSNTFFNGCDVVGRELQDLWDEMAQRTLFERRVELAEQYLLGRLADALENSQIANAAHNIFNKAGLVRIDDIARRSSLSVRQFERRFINEIGIAPKLFARVARFQAVLDTKIRCEKCTWMSLAHEYEFHDQMHMIKDFQRLSGYTPDQLVNRIGDLRPEATIASSENGPSASDYSELNSAINFRTVLA